MLTMTATAGVSLLDAAFRAGCSGELAAIAPVVPWWEDPGLVPDA